MCYASQVLTVADATSGEVIFTGSVAGGAYAVADVCLKCNSTYTIETSSGTYDSDVSWMLHNVVGSETGVEYTLATDSCEKSPRCTYDMVDETTVHVTSSFALDCALSNLSTALPARGESSMTVILDGDLPFERMEQFTVTRALDLTIVGRAPSRAVISGGGITRLFYAKKGSMLTLDAVTLADGHASGVDSSFEACGGGIIAIDATIVLINVTLRKCFASSYGGGFYALRSTAVVYDTNISDNTATNGGGIAASGYSYAISPSVVTVQGSSVECVRCSFTENYASQVKPL